MSYKGTSISKICKKCHKEFLIEVDFYDYAKFFSGEDINIVLPYLNYDEISMLKYNMCEKCYKLEKII